MTLIYEKMKTKTWDYFKYIPRCPDKGAFEISFKGEIYFVVDSKLHREEGPAAIYIDGTQAYYQNGNLHREDGPAWINPNGGLEYWQNGKLHRLDGPAWIFPDGREFYYLFDKKYQKEQWEPLAIQLSLKGQIA